MSRLTEGETQDSYRAIERESGQEVAVKIVAPKSCVSESKALERAQWELAVHANLRHHNIASIYRIEEISASQAIVSELVDGESLRERLETGPLTVREALTVFQAVASGLAAAHQKRIVHCNLKPKNIRISIDDVVKIIDFRLARVLGETHEKDRMVDEGAGTPSYMSPEQARSEAIDERADVWAFGCCLYESLAGRKPFVGRTVADVTRAVCGSEPDFTLLPQNIPARVLFLLKRCLEKAPELRLRSMDDIALWLKYRD